MSSDNIAQTLGAVSTALEHFADRLDRAGFGEGVPAYQKMSKVVIGQQQWAAERGLHDFDQRFCELAKLAAGIRQHLEPYVEAMSRLEALAGLVSMTQENPEELESSDTTVLSALLEAGRPQSLTQVSTATSMPTRFVRIALEHLMDTGAVRAARSGGRRRYVAQR